jgi:hypothetical protein
MELADKIADSLFTDGDGQKAERLVLELPNGRNGGGWCRDAVRGVIQAAISEPINMVLPCPRCRRLHVDAPEPGTAWTNPPHKSHKCHNELCVDKNGERTIWRPADVPTNGVASIATRGDADTWPDV